jgi:hypothetical protein
VEVNTPLLREAMAGVEDVSASAGARLPTRGRRNGVRRPAPEKKSVAWRKLTEVNGTAASDKNGRRWAALIPRDAATGQALPC